MKTKIKKTFPFRYLVLPHLLLAASTTVILAAEETQASRTLSVSSADQIIKMILGLIFVVGLIFLIAWVAKNYLGFNPSPNSSLKPIAGLTLGQKERVVLIQVSDRQILLGVAPGRVNVLHVLEKGSEVSPDDTQKSVFSEKLQMTLKKLERNE